MRDAGYAEAPAGAFLHGLYQLSLHSPFCLWVYETVASIASAVRPRRSTIIS